MREDIEFGAEGVILRGWFYRPDSTSNRVATVVMAHGFSAVMEMYLDHFAEVFVEAGLAVLVFDNRGLGASGGQPRGEIDPWQQVRDYRHAMTYARTRPDVDPGRIGVWGSSYSGGHALVVGAIDRRARCVVSQVPLVSGLGTIQRLVRADFLAFTRAVFDEDRRARYAGSPPQVVPVVGKGPSTVSALPTADAYEWFTETSRSRASAWQNEVTLRSLEMLSEYEPATYVSRISPTPLLLVVARDDHVTRPGTRGVRAGARAQAPRAAGRRSLRCLHGRRVRSGEQRGARLPRGAPGGRRVVELREW